MITSLIGLQSKNIYNFGQCQNKIIVVFHFNLAISVYKSKKFVYTLDTENKIIVILHFNLAISVYKSKILGKGKWIKVQFCGGTT